MQCLVSLVLVSLYLLLVYINIISCYFYLFTSVLFIESIIHGKISFRFDIETTLFGRQQRRVFKHNTPYVKDNNYIQKD